MRTKTFLAKLCLLLAASVTLCCSRDPEVAKREYLQSGNKYFQEKKYQEAIIQYRNAIQRDPRFGEARYKLAQAYEAAKDPLNALREYVRAADLLPDDPDAQLRAGSMLALAGQFEDARARAQKVLAKDPKNLNAQILQANATAGLKDLTGAVNQIEEAIRIDPTQQRSYRGLGTLERALGNRAEAEAAFKKAVEVDPSSVDAHVSLANYYWSAGRRTEAEAELKRALAIDPRNQLANRALAGFYQATDRPAEAEKYLKMLVEISNDSDSRINLATYYVLSHRYEEAIPILEQAATDKNAYVAAKTRIAAVKYLSRQREAAHATLDEALQREPNNARALVLKARFLYQEHKLDDALSRAKAAVAADARLAEAEQVLGLVHGARNEQGEAIAAFNDALKLNPRDSVAQTQLARLHLAQGRIDASLAAGEEAVKSPTQDPEAHLILARALIMKGSLERAESELKAVSQKYPKLAEAPALAGSLYMRKKDRGAAERSFELALELDRHSLEALTGLVTLDLDAGQIAKARARVEAAAADTPRDPGVHLVAAKVYAAERNPAREEQALRSALEVDPSNLAAYSGLARLYLSQGKLEEARLEFENVANRQPKEVAARTMVAIIFELEKNQPEAQKRYEQILQLDPTAAVAANNLAWLYAERGGNLDVALQLAQTANAKVAERAEFNDTLGWVYYKKNLVTLAIRPFQQSVQKDPGNPIFHYHLGLAYAKNGDESKARQSLQQALKLKPDFEGAVEAKRVLASLPS